MAVSAPLTFESAQEASTAAFDLRVRLEDGAATSAYVAMHSLRTTDLRVVQFERAVPLVTWCEQESVGDALVGGFFTRPDGVPLGELWRAGRRQPSEPFLSPWDAWRSCVHVESGRVAIAPRHELPRRPRGDLLQAGPLLARRGTVLIDDGVDPEGFSGGREQFDSDITVGRYPRAALGVGSGALLAVACDGRAENDCGLTLAELARLMVELGAEDAINLDGGGSTSLVRAGMLANRPREEHGLDLAAGRPISTALVFGARRR